MSVNDSRQVKVGRCVALVVTLVATGCAAAASADIGGRGPVSDDVIQDQREELDSATSGKGFGPQSPRDIEQVDGGASEMNLCNIHFHKNAEHRGGEFTVYAGNGDGKGFGTGYKYSGTLTEAELAPYENGVVGPDGRGGLVPGDTIEIHYVYSTAQVEPGPTLGACLNESIGNPQLRVEAQVFVLVNDDHAADLIELTKIGTEDGYAQALNIPSNTGQPVSYEGSTTGPKFNEQGSPLQVSWSVRPEVIKVDIATVDNWLGDNVFEENAAQGVRNLVINPDLLSQID